MVGQDVATVERWHALLNAGDVDGMLALVHPDVAIGGPRGTSRGRQVVREWFGRAGVRLTPARYFGRDSIVVVEEEGVWQVSGGAADRRVVWSLFAVHDGMVTRIQRFDSLATALAAAGLDEADEVVPFPPRGA